MKNFLNSIWNLLIEIGEARQEQLRKTGYKGWY